ncbi:MAG: LysR family transcriptional regulator [Myxococcaceae bacterium]
MNLRNLRYFCAAYEQGSTVAAARTCFVTQPTVSAGLAQLEEELGVQLFERQQRGLTPNEHGHRLYRKARSLLEEADALVSSFRTEAAVPRLALRLLPSLHMSRVERVLLLARRAVPGLQVNIVGPEDPCDASLTAQSCLRPGERFRPLWEERYVLVLPPGASGGPSALTELAQLEGLPFIERSHCELGEALQTALGEAGVRLDVRATVASEEWALALVAAGVGATVVPAHVAATRPELPRIEPGEGVEAPLRQVGLAWRGQASEALQALLSACESAWISGG